MIKINFQSDKFFIKTSFWWRLILTPIRIAAEFIGVIVAVLFSVLGIASFYVVGLWWGVVVILAFCYCWLKLEDKFQNLGNMFKGDWTGATKSFFKVLNSEGWSEDMEALYALLPDDRPLAFNLRQALEYAVSNVDDSYRENPNNNIFIEAREEIQPSCFATLKNPYYSVWVYERYAASIGIKPTPEIVHDVHTLQQRYVTLLAEEERKEGISKKAEKNRINKLNDENAFKLNFLNEKLKEITLSNDWRLTVKHATDKYLKEFNEICPYKIVRIDGEWQISKQS